MQNTEDIQIQLTEGPFLTGFSKKNETERFQKSIEKATYGYFHTDASM
jgi:hypothetical protein